MKHWFADTLAKRLLLLMWAALVASHLVAYVVVHSLHIPPAGPGPQGALPTFPSLPPTPGLAEERARPPAPPGGMDDRASPLPQQMPRKAPPAREGGAGGLPWDALLLDYGIRFLVIALAAWFGSRWLAAPMRRLVDASTALGRSLAGDAPLPVLDERRGTSEVREAARVFNSMARQLREQFRARGLMLAAISHDLRTPLTRLRMRLETAESPPALRQRSVDDIAEMDTLIGETLELFRLEGGSAETAQAVDVGALVQAVVDDHAEQGLAVTAEAAAGAVAVAPPLALRRVVSNLLGNALRYGVRAQVRIETDVERVLVTIDDHGPGIPPEDLEVVFQPFYRVENSRSRCTGGTGLGLYIARDLMHRMGGTLALTNRSKGGLRACICLPRRTQ